MHWCTPLLLLREYTIVPTNWLWLGTRNSIALEGAYRPHESAVYFFVRVLTHIHPNCTCLPLLPSPRVSLYTPLHASLVELTIYTNTHFSIGRLMNTSPPPFSVISLFLQNYQHLYNEVIDQSVIVCDMPTPAKHTYECLGMRSVGKENGNTTSAKWLILGQGMIM